MTLRKIATHVSISVFVIFACAVGLFLRTARGAGLSFTRRRDIALAIAPIVGIALASVFTFKNSRTWAIRLALLGPVVYGTVIALATVINRMPFLVKRAQNRLKIVVFATAIFLFAYLLYCSFDLLAKPGSGGTWFLASSATFFAMSSLSVMHLLNLLEAWEESSNLTPGIRASTYAPFLRSALSRAKR